MKYSDIFIGTPPKFEETKLKRGSFTANVVQKKEKKRNKMLKETVEIKKREGEVKKKNGEIKKKDIEIKKKDENKKKGRPFMTEEEKEAIKRRYFVLKLNKLLRFFTQV